MILFFLSDTDPQHQASFEQWLCEVNSSDGISLLTALAQMATPTQRSDSQFITTITLLIYQVGGANFSETSINFVTQHNSSSLIRICTVSV